MPKRLLTFVVFSVVLVVLVAGCVGEQHPTCQLWKKMAQQLSNEPRKQMSCFANDTHPCTSLRCSGTYKYTSFMPDSADIEVDYCFGMRLNHCDNPVSMDIYLVVPNKNMSYNQRISHNTQIQMPGLSFHLKSLGTVDVFLYFYMLRNASNIHMSITAKFRITSFMKTIMWPPSLQKEIVPMESIPVPPCLNHSTVSPPTTLPMGSCHPPRWIAPTYAPGVSSTPSTPHSRYNASVTYNHTCHEDTFICSAKEACNLQTRKCVCRANFLYDPRRKRCVSKSRIGIRCSSTTDCGPNEDCISGRCTCKVGYTFSVFREVCYAGVPQVSPVSPQGPRAVTLPNKQQPQTAPPPASNILIEVTRDECPMLTPCSQTHAAALSSLTSGPPDCSLLQSFTHCVRSCLSSDQSVLDLSIRISHVCAGQLPQRTADMEQGLQHIVSWFAKGTSLHLNVEDLRLLLNCSAVSTCVPQNISSLSGEDTCNVAGSLYKCVDAALMTCDAPDAIRSFLASQKQDIDRLCKSGYRTVLPSLFVSLDDGLSALSSPGCVELMKCTEEGQSLGPPLEDKEAFCTTIKVVNTCIDESKEECAVSSQFRSFINRYRDEESEHCYSGVGLPSISLPLLLLTAIMYCLR